MTESDTVILDHLCGDGVAIYYYYTNRYIIDFTQTGKVKNGSKYYSLI